MALSGCVAQNAADGSDEGGDADGGGVTTTNTPAGTAAGDESVGETPATALPADLGLLVVRGLAAQSDTLWVMTDEGVATLERPLAREWSTGARGKWAAWSEKDSPRIHLEPLPGSDRTRARAVTVGEEGEHVSGLWMSPDERDLFVALILPRDPATDGGRVRLALVDVGSGTTSFLGWIDPLPTQSSIITALEWGPAGERFAFSLGQPGGSKGEETYLCRLGHQSVERVTRVTSVLDVGPSGEVLGLGEVAEPQPPSLGEGTPEVSAGSRTIVLSEDGTVHSIPRHEEMRRKSRAWLSPDTEAIVVEGDAEFSDTEDGVWEDAPEVLQVQDNGSWRLSHLVRIPEPPHRETETMTLPGVGFGRTGTSFWVQEDVPEEDGRASGVWLGLLDTQTGRYELKMPLPGAGQRTTAAIVNDTCAD